MSDVVLLREAREDGEERDKQRKMERKRHAFMKHLGSDLPL